jgi:glycine cleavage system H protein
MPVPAAPRPKTEFLLQLLSVSVFLDETILFSPCIDIVFEKIKSLPPFKIKNTSKSIMNIPDDLLYTKDHEWIRIEGNHATIGITDHAQSELGDIVYVDIKTLNEQLERNAVFGTVEAVKTVSDLFLPMSGTITEVNPELESNPELVNKDPYGKGWMIKITLSNPAEKSELLSAEAYRQLTGA